MTAALAAYAAGQGSEHAVLLALDSARLMVPVVALPAAEDAPGPGGLRREKSSEMALPTVIGGDGRAALPAFTSAASLARWRPGARPVPVPAAQVWQSGAQDASAVVIDIAGPVPFAVDGARLAALAQGRPRCRTRTRTCWRWPTRRWWPSRSSVATGCSRVRTGPT